MATATITSSTTPQHSGSGSRIPLHRNPLRLAASASPWRSAWYLAGHLTGGAILGAAAALAAAAGATVAATVAGFPLLRPAAGAVRGCADAERRRLRLVWAEPVRARYATADGTGVLARALGRWRDPAIWRDLGYLVALWVPLALLDATVLSLWAASLIGITLPFWYWAPRGAEVVGYVHGSAVHGVPFGYFPHGPAGSGALGLYIDTMPRAILAAVIFGALFLLCNYLLVKAAKAHVTAARTLLGPPRTQDSAMSQNSSARP